MQLWPPPNAVVAQYSPARTGPSAKVRENEHPVVAQLVHAGQVTDWPQMVVLPLHSP